MPAYTPVDRDGAVAVRPWLRVGAGVSNAPDARDLTRRPPFHPGPGVWTSDGRAVRVFVEQTP